METYKDNRHFKLDAKFNAQLRRPSLTKLLFLFAMILLPSLSTAGVSFQGYCSEVTETSCKEYGFFVEGSVPEATVVAIVNQITLGHHEDILRITRQSDSVIIIRTGERVGKKQLYLSGSVYTYELIENEWKLVAQGIWVS